MEVDTLNFICPSYFRVNGLPDPSQRTCLMGRQGG